MVAGRASCCFTVTELQSYPSPHLTTSYAYIDPSLTTSQPPCLTLGPSLDSSHSPLHHPERGSVWPGGEEERRQTKIPVPAVCLVVDAGRFNDRAGGSWPDQQPQVGSIMFLLFTITLSFTDQTCCYCSHIRAIISLKLI